VLDDDDPARSRFSTYEGNTLKLTKKELLILTAYLSEVEEGTTPSQRKLATTLTRLRLRMEAELEKSPKKDREVRWAASVISSLADHEDTCPRSAKLFKKVADELQDHADLSVGCL